MVNAQAKSNRRWYIGNRLVEPGILGHRNGNEEVENIGEQTNSQKGGTINIAITDKS